MYYSIVFIFTFIKKIRYSIRITHVRILLADIVIMAKSCIVKGYAWALVLLIGIGSVTSRITDDESDGDSAFDWVKANPGKVAVGAAVGAGAAVLAAPVAVGYLGFTATGIAAKSAAAWAMSWFAGSTTAGGIIATLQSIGATGSVLGSGVATVATGTVGAVVGAGVAKATTSDNDKNRN